MKGRLRKVHIDGGSLGVTIPPAMAKEVGLADGSLVEFDVEGKMLKMVLKREELGTPW